MSDESSPTLGARLRAARQASNLSIADIAERTRIRGALVREIEADSFAGSGGDVYARGHVRAIASAVGLDATELARQFDVEHGSSTPELVTASLPAFEPTKTQADRSGPGWLTAMVAAAAVVAALVVASFVFSLFERGHPRGAATAASGSPTARAPQPSPSAGRSFAPHAPTPASGVNLRVRIVGGQSWVRVTNAAGTALFQGVLRAGMVKDFRDGRQLVVRYGNSHAVAVAVNGREPGPPSCGRIVCTQRYEADQAAG